jgi:uncharacterized protein (TIGR04141 family)
MHAKHKVPKNSLTIYLLKGTDLDKLVKPGLTGNEIRPGLTLYTRQSEEEVPRFIPNFFQIYSNSENHTNVNKAYEELRKLRSISASAVLFVSGVEGKVFAVTFGYGRFLINENSIVRQFGLKTALGMIEEDGIKNLQKITLESNPKHSLEQLSQGADKTEFGINVDKDVLRGISGRIKSVYARFGLLASGSDPLTLNVDCTVDNIKDVVSEINCIYESKEYQKDFSWIDQMKFVKDKATITKLDSLLIEAIEAGDFTEQVRIWASVPEYVDFTKISGFRVGRGSEVVLDFGLQDIINALKADFSVDNFKKFQILGISSDDNSVIHRWSAYKCLYSEVKQKNAVYILVDGDWFEIDTDYADEVSGYFKSVRDSTLNFPDYDDSCSNEADYNTKLYNEIGGVLMDSDLIPYGGVHSKIEVCDVFSKTQDLIHVKKYISSSTFSHFFNQGLVSGELLRWDHDFRRLHVNLGGI